LNAILHNKPADNLFAGLFLFDLPIYLPFKYRQKMACTYRLKTKQPWDI
jgi:hypothetical protein